MFCAMELLSNSSLVGIVVSVSVLVVSVSAGWCAGAAVVGCERRFLRHDCERDLEARDAAIVHKVDIVGVGA